MSGIVQKLSVEADDEKILKHVVEIILMWHHSLSHYRTGVDINGVPYLIMMWADAGDGRCVPLMSVLKNSDVIGHQICSWLGSTQYSDMPDNDGTCKKGYKITCGFESAPCLERVSSNTWNKFDYSFYDSMCIQPKWIEYHK